MSVTTTVQEASVTVTLSSDTVATSVSEPTVAVTVSGGDTVVTEMQGPAGLSAYQVALNNGFVGTQAEWLASLQVSATSLPWGQLTGTLSSQTDLQAALDGKQPQNAKLTSLAGLSLTTNSGMVIKVNATEDGFVLAPDSGGSSGSSTWGSITGTLSTQTDLQTALNAKANLTGATFSGPITATNLSGTNTGDQTISITGDVTASGSTGALTATVTKINGVALSGLATGILKNTATTGVPGIAVAADFPTLNQNTTGSAATLTTGRTIGMTGDVTWTSPAFNGSANVTAAATIGANKVTLAQMAQVATSSVMYRKTAATGNWEAQTLATLKTDLGLTGTNSGDQTITLTGDVTGSGTGSFATTIGTGAVTLAKMANLAANSIIGNNTGVSAVPLALTGTQVTAMLDAFTSTTKGLAPASGGGTTNFLRADGTWAAPPAGGSATWGSITGTLSSQTDLQTALNAKQDASTAVTLAGSQTLTGAKTFSANPNIQNSSSTGTSMLFVTCPSNGRAAIDVGGSAGPSLFDAHFGNHLSGGADLQIHCGSGNVLFYSNNSATAQLTLNSTGLTATGTVTGSNLSGTNTGDETSSTILTKLSGASGGGTTNFLRADGTWAAPAGGGGALTSASNYLSADLSLATGSTWFDAASVSLAAGTWLIQGFSTVSIGSNSTLHVTARLNNNTDGTLLTSQEVAPGGGSSPHVAPLAMSTIVTLAATKTIALSATCTSGGVATVLAGAPNNGSPLTNATGIVAVKIG